MSKICITPINESAAETGTWGKYRGVDLLLQEQVTKDLSVYLGHW